MHQYLHVVTYNGPYSQRGHLGSKRYSWGGGTERVVPRSGESGPLGYCCAGENVPPPPPVQPNVSDSKQKLDLLDDLIWAVLDDVEVATLVLINFNCTPP